MGETRLIYRTFLTIRGHVELKTTTKKHELPMRPVSGEVWHASWSMKDRVRAGFDVGRKETSFVTSCEVFIAGLHDIVIFV
jgi:hypothetical protein